MVVNVCGIANRKRKNGQENRNAPNDVGGIIVCVAARISVKRVNNSSEVSRNERNLRNIRVVVDHVCIAVHNEIFGSLKIRVFTNTRILSRLIVCVVCVFGFFANFFFGFFVFSRLSERIRIGKCFRLNRGIVGQTTRWWTDLGRPLGVVYIACR